PYTTLFRSRSRPGLVAETAGPTPHTGEQRHRLPLAFGGADAVLARQPTDTGAGPAGRTADAGRGRRPAGGRDAPRARLREASPGGLPGRPRRAPSCAVRAGRYRSPRNPARGEDARRWPARAANGECPRRERPRDRRAGA